MDKYENFRELCAIETEGVDFRVTTKMRKGAVTAIIAPHGGAIEPGTSELALAIAGADLNFATFDGLKAQENRDLHITSTKFDEPRIMDIVARSKFVLAIHGERSSANVAYVGGSDEELKDAIRDALGHAGIKAETHDSSALGGASPQNICNRGTRGMGVQLELGRGLRTTLFPSLGSQGRKRTSPRFDDFVTAVRNGLHCAGAL